MTQDQFNKALAKLFAAEMPNGVMSMGQVEFARTIGVSDRMVRRWAAGKWPVPVHFFAMLLNLMLKTKSSAEDLKA